MKTIRTPDSIYPIFERKGGAEPDATHYCPGCGHGVVHKLLAKVVDELGIQDRTILISPVGCSVFAYYYFDVGNVQAAHGRAPAVGTGIKRARPDSIVISYQGDGDLAAIGGNNILQAANRGENMTVVFVNNAIYGMTGGQLAPTSPLGMKTTTTPRGRAFEDYGAPMRVAELLSPLEGVSFSARHSLTSPGNINKTKKALKKALKYQMEGKGFSLVEILSQCPTGWKMDPVESIHWIDDKMTEIFPPGTFKDEPHPRSEKPPHPANYDADAVERTLGVGNAANDLHATEGIPWNLNINGSTPTSLSVRAAGFGGQGILLLGELLARCGIDQGVQVTWLPSYGPEMRGGTANCSVVVSTQRIGNPMAEHPEIVMAMNRPSLERFEPAMVPGGVLLYDSSLIEGSPERSDLHVYAIPATKIADGIGSAKVANVVLAGALSQVLGFPSKESLVRVVGEISKTPELEAMNRQALEAGIKAAGEGGAK